VASARLSLLARRRTAIRELVYRLLVRSPTRSWTVAQLARELGTTNDRVRSVLYVLLADNAVVTVPGQRQLTMALTENGEQSLRWVLARWRPQPSPGDASKGRPAGGRRAGQPFT